MLLFVSVLAHELAHALMARAEGLGTGNITLYNGKGIWGDNTAAGDPTLTDRTWVQIVESPDGGWGIAGHANTNADIAQLARRALAGG